AGTGLLYLLRWYWWRINAWSEVSAMIGSFVVATAFFVARKSDVDVSSWVPVLGDQLPLIATVGITTLIWILTTLITKPTDHGTLVRFYELVRPAGPGWKHVRASTTVAGSPDRLADSMLGWV